MPVLRSLCANRLKGSHGTLISKISENLGENLRLRFHSLAPPNSRLCNQWRYDFFNAMLPVCSQVKRVTQISQHQIEKIIVPHVYKLILCNKQNYGKDKLISKPNKRRKEEQYYEKNNESKVIGLITPQCCIKKIIALVTALVAKCTSFHFMDEVLHLHYFLNS